MQKFTKHDIIKIAMMDSTIAAYLMAYRLSDEVSWEDMLIQMVAILAQEKSAAQAIAKDAIANAVTPMRIGSV